MKKLPISRRTGSVLACTAALVFGAEPAAPALNATFVDPAAREVAEIRSVGETAINRLAFTMVNELNTALAKGGIESAIELAHLKNLPKTGDRVTGLPRIKTIKLTSFRLRAGNNAPDAADQLALDQVLKELSSDAGPPKVLVQRIGAPGTAAEWRVYRPVGVMPVCMKCHGDVAEQPADLRAKLGRLYPTDQATGYRVGEFRGLLRVTVDNAPPPPPPSQPAAPAKAAPRKK
ncbi:MAG: DUF3365 domain-containing protein [Verrucomicrobia bacterium]|nr:DUF3365 domain-containing protein [Verrucomicrobiota bacterium]